MEKTNSREDVRRLKRHQAERCCHYPTGPPGIGREKGNDMKQLFEKARISVEHQIYVQTGR